MNRNDAESVIKDTIEYANNEIGKAKKKSRKIVEITIIFAVLVIILLGSSFVSYVTFGTANPFSAASGYFQITVLDKAYVEVRTSPKVVIAQPDGELLTEYMRSRGFEEIEEEQMGGMRVFANGVEKEWISCSMNGYFSKWCWQ